jgi:hypothetical protein
MGRLQDGLQLVGPPLTRDQIHERNPVS